MFDPRSVVLQVQEGKQSSNWRIYHGRGNYGCAVTCWVCTACSGIFFLSALSIGISGMLLGLCCVIPCVYLSMKYTRKGDFTAKSILVILPEGVVQGKTNDSAEVAWFYFAGISKIELAHETEIVGFDGDIYTKICYWLDVYCRDGNYFKWWLPSQFGDAASIGKTIIAAYNYY